MSKFLASGEITPYSPVGEILLIYTYNIYIIYIIYIYIYIIYIYITCLISIYYIIYINIYRRFVKNRNTTLLYEWLLVLYQYKTFFERHTNLNLKKIFFNFIYIFMYTLCIKSHFVPSV